MDTDESLAYIASLFEQEAGRRDFTRYINEELAGDFAWVLATTLKAREAALREDLTRAKQACAKEFESVQLLDNENVVLKQRLTAAQITELAYAERLTAAEQRNAELMSRIGDAFERLVCITPRNNPSGVLKQQAMEILQGAARKPTESEESGSTCNQIREESGLPINKPCIACNNCACIDR